jgi:uncharacterized protein involved in exopolysaccharide biosynthesis
MSYSAGELLREQGDAAGDGALPHPGPGAPMRPVTGAGESRAPAVSASLVGVLRLLCARRRRIVAITAAGVLVSLVYAFTTPVQFISTTTLMPPDSFSSNLGSLAAVAGPAAAAGLGSTLLGIKSPGAMFVGILGSRTVQQRLVTRFNLVRLFKVRNREDAGIRLAASTSITEDPRSGIITVGVRARNASLASQLAAGYVEELDSTVNHTTTSAARRERMFLEERLQQIKSDLDTSAETLSQFSSKNTTIDLSSQAKAMIDAGFKLQTDLVAARSSLAGLRQVYSEDNLRVRSVNARIAELEREMDKLTGRSAAASPLAGNTNSDYPTIRELPALGRTYSELTRQVKVEEALWETLTKQYEVAKVQEAKEIPTVRVLDAANVPYRKSAPDRGMIVALGTLLSLLAGCLSVLAVSIWESMDAQDDRKKLARELVGPPLAPLRWLRRRPVWGRMVARFVRRGPPVAGAARSHG